MPAEVWQQFGNLGAALTVLGKFPGRSKELLAGPIDEAIDDLAGIFLARVLGQLRLGVQQVHVGGAAVHEHRDHGPSFGRRMRGLGREVELAILARHVRSGQQLLLLEQPGQGHTAHAQSVARQKLPPRGN